VSLDDEKAASSWERFRRGLLERVPAEATATHLALADAYLEMGLLDDAEAEFALVLDVRPDDPSARRSRSDQASEKSSSARFDRTRVAPEPSLRI
jgi:hypothetical protein